MPQPTNPPFADDDARWEAVVQRDPLADGRFCYAVATTGIYCRPTCPSRRPKRENVRFFDSPAAAQKAGFRSCRRCLPEGLPDGLDAPQRVVAQVRELLEASESTPTLAHLGEAVGLSPYHLQRLFKRATGLTPKAYARLSRSERLKAGLRNGDSVTEAMYEAGYGSARALYDQAHQDLGMTPGTYRNGGLGEEIAYGCAETPLGAIMVAATKQGVCFLRFGEEAALLAEMRAEFPRARIAPEQAAVAPYTDWVLAYLAGDSGRPVPALDLSATAFQSRVWGALQAIPYGQTRSYQEMAAMIGAPKAVRAVARACAANPVALLIPCHRVIRTGGGLSGYRWGVERKRALLEGERRE